MRLGKVAPRARTGQIIVVDEVFDVFVKQERRHRTGLPHEVLNAQVEVARLQRFEVRVAEFSLVILDHKARRQLAEGRAHHGVGPGGTHLGVFRQLVTRMQARQPVVVVALGVLGFIHAVADARALGVELGAFVAQAGDKAPVVDVYGVHQVRRVDVFVHDEVVHPRALLIVELVAVQPAEQVFDRPCADARTITAEGVIQLALAEAVEVQLVIAEAQLREVFVGPGFGVVVFAATADFAAELELRGVAVHVVIARQVETDVLFFVFGDFFLHVDFVEDEVGRVIKTRADDRPGLFRVVPAAVGEA